MSNSIEKAAHEIGKAAKNVRDAVSEKLHDANADAEKDRREALGDELTLGDKARSVADEATERAKAGLDHTKHTVREII